MSYKKFNKLGKVKEYKKESGVGEIATLDDVYMFTIGDLDEELNKGDLVKFRAEVVNDVNRAFFIHKIDNIYHLKNDNLKVKILEREQKK